MAYSKDNLFEWGLTDLRGAWRAWVYRSPDALATVVAAGYISNATAMGMKVDDVVLVVDTTNHLLDWCVVAAITAGAADLTNGLRITATNSG